MAQSQLDTATARRDEAAATVDKTRAVIAQKRIVAAFPGRLGIRKVDVGQYVSPGMPLVPLQALDQIYADFPLPEQDLARIAVGMPAKVVFKALPNEVVEGRVTFVLHELDAARGEIRLLASEQIHPVGCLPGLLPPCFEHA